MRLKSVWIGNYKNLRDFTLGFDGDAFIDIFVGKNGSGKSNFIEAAIQIFDHLYSSKPQLEGPKFDYQISWELTAEDYSIHWIDGALSAETAGKNLKTLRRIILPKNVIVYYSGQNQTVTSLVQSYRTSYRKSIRSSDVADIPRIIGIGADHKAVLLATMLLMQETTRARRFLCEKLKIQGIGESARLVLKRPIVATKSRQYDPFDNEEIFWGVKGIARDFLEDLMDCITGDFTPGSLYERETDTYQIEINIDLFREKFVDRAQDELFCLFHALHALEMIEDISLRVRLSDDVTVTSRAFSDGQFQSIYIFAISELFKDRECLTFLDEPDAFLHPEWQYQFLSQVHAISEEASRSNHILMSTHSASTIAANVDTRLRVFEADVERVVSSERDKSEVISSLSAGLITFSEREARLSIYEILEHTDDAVLFTEGLSDKIILDAAISKLFPGEHIGLVVQGAFDRIFLRNLFSRDELQRNYPGRKMYALFDFDDAYTDWCGLSGADMVEQDPSRGLGKRLTYPHHCAFLLPVPVEAQLRCQALNAQGAPFADGSASLDIELLFCDPANLSAHYARKEVLGGGEVIEFRGNKLNYARDVIANLDAERFECFRPLLEFIRRDIGN